MSVNNVKSVNTGNCIPIQDIDILHYSSTDHIKVLNNNSIGINSDPITNEDNASGINSFILDHNYICDRFENFISLFYYYFLNSLVYIKEQVMKRRVECTPIMVYFLYFLKHSNF